jgi:hypothetical protein
VLESTLCSALKHPLRARILEVVNEIQMSPSQFVRQGLVPEEMYSTYQQALSLSSYHFRELEKEGCLEVVDMIPRRGAAEHVYKGVSRVFFSDAEFEKLPHATRQGLSRSSVQGVLARTDGAVRSGTFDKRPDRHLTWRASRMDEEGWTEITEIFADAYARAEDACARAVERIGSGGEGESFPMTWAMLAYESPPMNLRF